MPPYGIDLGTRNTAVECAAGRLSTAQGATIPSAVAYDSLTLEKRFGDDAIRLLREENPQIRDRWAVATSFKTALESDAPFVRTPGGTKTAQGVLQDYLGFLVGRANAQGLPSLDSAVFSIPVGFSALSRQRFLAAARAVGIKPIGIVAEPTAAYLNVAAHLGAAQSVAVVDWGAGTLDVSVLKLTGAAMTSTQVEEHRCQGSNIAGDHIDSSLYEHFAGSARREGRDIPLTTAVPLELMRTILRRCESEKIRLSTPNANPNTTLTFPRFVDGKLAQFNLTSQDLRDLGAPARESVFKVLESAILGSGLTIQRIDRIIFVGGCTNLLGFREEAEFRYGTRAIFLPATEWAVASGALQVARGGAAYSCLQEFGCVLDDGSFLPLCNGRIFDDTRSTISVAVTGHAQFASLVFADRQSGHTSMVGAISVPLQGHVGEPVHIRTTLNCDLTVGIEAWSQCGNAQDVKHLYVPNTRFRFEMTP